MLDNLVDIIQEGTGLPILIISGLLKSILTVLILFVTKKVVEQIVWRRTHDVALRYKWKKGLSLTVMIVASLILGRIWIKGFDSITTFLGLLSAGIAISLKDILASIAGWFYIIIKRPFTLGDRIQIGENSGDVIDVDLFKFTIMEIGNWVDADQSTGRMIIIPNGSLFVMPLQNYTLGFNFIWNEVPVTLTFESNWKKAKSILEDVISEESDWITKTVEHQIKEASKKFMIYYNKLTPIVYTCVKPNGIVLTMRYLCESRKRRTTEHLIWEQVLTLFASENDIEFAYPTTRFYNHRNEGKNISFKEKYSTTKETVRDDD